MTTRVLRLVTLCCALHVALAAFGDTVILEDTSFVNPPPAPLMTLTLTPTAGEPTMLLEFSMENNCSVVEEGAPLSCPVGYTAITQARCVPPVTYKGNCTWYPQLDTDATDGLIASLPGLASCGIVFPRSDYSGYDCPFGYTLNGDSVTCDRNAESVDMLCISVHAIKSTSDFTSWGTEWADCAVVPQYMHYSAHPNTGTINGDGCGTGWTLDSSHQRCAVTQSGGSCPTNFRHFDNFCVKVLSVDNAFYHKRNVNPDCVVLPSFAVSGTDFTSRLAEVKRCGLNFDCDPSGFDVANQANWCPVGWTYNSTSDSCSDPLNPASICGVVPSLSGGIFLNSGNTSVWDQCGLIYNCTNVLWSTFGESCPLSYMSMTASGPLTTMLTSVDCVQSSTAFSARGINGSCWTFDPIFDEEENTAVERAQQLEECDTQLPLTAVDDCTALERPGFWQMSWNTVPNIDSPDTCNNIKARGSNYAGYTIDNYVDIEDFPLSFTYADNPTSLTFDSNYPSRPDTSHNAYSIEGTVNSFFQNCDSTWVSGEPWATNFYWAFIEKLNGSTSDTYRYFEYAYNLTVTQESGAWISSSAFSSAKSATPQILSILTQRDGSTNNARVTMMFSITVPNSNTLQSTLRLSDWSMTGAGTGSVLVGLESPFDTVGDFPAMADYGVTAGLDHCTRSSTGDCVQTWSVTMDIQGAVDANNYLRFSGTQQADIEVYNGTSTVVRTELINFPISLAIPPNITGEVTVAIETESFTATDSASNVFDLTTGGHVTLPNDMLTIKTQLQASSLRPVFDLAARLLIVCYQSAAGSLSTVALNGGNLGAGCLGASPANRAVIYQDETWLTNNGYGTIVQGGDFILSDPVYAVSSAWDSTNKLQVLEFKNVFLSGAAQSYVYTAIYDVVTSGLGARRLIASTTGYAPALNSLVNNVAGCPTNSHYVSISDDCACDDLYVFNADESACLLDTSTVNAINNNLRTYVTGVLGGLAGLAVVSLAMTVAVGRLMARRRQTGHQVLTNQV